MTIQSKNLKAAMSKMESFQNIFFSYKNTFDSYLKLFFLHKN